MKWFEFQRELMWAQLIHCSVLLLFSMFTCIFCCAFFCSLLPLLVYFGFNRFDSEWDANGSTLLGGTRDFSNTLPMSCVLPEWKSQCKIYHLTLTSFLICFVPIHSFEQHLFIFNWHRRRKACFFFWWNIQTLLQVKSFPCLDGMEMQKGDFKNKRHNRNTTHCRMWTQLHASFILILNSESIFLLNFSSELQSWQTHTFGT